jgi:DNA-binding CsgD family transcriptional regulator
MEQNMAVKCNRCGYEIPFGEEYEYYGQILCEDCYIDIRYPTKGCDPWAVYSANRSRQREGLKGTDGLTERQREIYDFIRRSGKVTREELIENLNLTESEVQTHLAILRHCELVKGSKEGMRIYFVPFD